MNRMIEVHGDAGAAVEEMMKIEGLNQTGLAKLMDCNRQAVQQSLHRRSGTMRVSTLARMAEAAGWKIVLTKCTKTQ